MIQDRYHRDADGATTPLALDPYAEERELKRQMHERAHARHGTPDLYADGDGDEDAQVHHVDAHSTDENALKAAMAARMSARSSK